MRLENVAGSDIQVPPGPRAPRESLLHRVMVRWNHRPLNSISQHLRTSIVTRLPLVIASVCICQRDTADLVIHGDRRMEVDTFSYREFKAFLEMR